MYIITTSRRDDQVVKVTIGLENAFEGIDFLRPNLRDEVNILKF